MSSDADRIRAAKRDAMRLQQAGDPGADAAWSRVLTLSPGDPEAHYALGQRAGDRGDFAKAVQHFRAALARMPGHPQLRASLAFAQEEAGSLKESESLWRALAADPRGDALQAQAQLARNLFRQRRYDDAQTLFAEADRRGAMGHPLLLAAYGACLARGGHADAAEGVFRRALTFGHDAPGVAREYAAFLIRDKRYADAASVLDAARAASGDDLLAVSMLLACRVELADWHDHAALRARLIAGVAASASQGRATDMVPAFDFLVLCDDPALQLTAARGWSASEVAGIAPLAPRPRRASRKLRLGFVSSDFGNHPVGRLVIALLERLDRERFEVIAFVTTAETRDAFRLRAERAVDQFAVIDRSDPARCAQALRAEAIDVLFDLNGYSGGEAVRIFAHRPAPLQVNFLGYTGTLGSPHYDVIVGDAYCIPADAEAAYTEGVVRIDSCYLPSDPLRMVDQGAPTRAQYGLPDTGVVFCAFAAIGKIDPSIFDVWMSLLRDTPDSVLWLRHIPTDRLARLRDEAQRRGVAATRLVVAPGDPIPRYLARFALADVFLDTAPFGSHTTVNDALFTGLPVVTIAGSSFAARASASQLAALGLHELIARDHAQYGEIALQLAASPSMRTTIAARLTDPAVRAPLFDMDAYARRFEAVIAGEFLRRFPDRSPR
ncbi:MAG: tetratricopeptide repeat protein [Casimicrobiaceae bacterium]